MPRAALETLCVLLLTLILIAWVGQDSIALYWRQSHHAEAPLESLKPLPGWSLGSILNAASIRLKASLAERLSGFDEWALAAISARTLDADPPSAGAAKKPAKPDISPFLEAEKPGKDADAAKERKNLAQKEIGVEDRLAPSARESKRFKRDEHPRQTPEAAAREAEKTAPAQAEVEAVPLGRKDSVLFVGDSLMQGVAPHVNVSLYKRYAIRSLDLSRQSTGLAYPGFFDWPRQVKEVFLEKRGIKLMVVFLGPNDPWDFPNPRGGPYLKFRSEAWENVYRGRIREMLGIARKNGAKVLWLAPPCMREKDLNRNMSYLSELFSDEVKSSQEFFLRAGELIGCDGERFVSFMDAGKKKIKSRFDDGIHFTRAGQKRIADEILSFIRFTPGEAAR